MTSQCLSKLLLDKVAPPGQSGRDLYQLYFESFALADADSNLSCVTSRPRQLEKIANSMYKTKKPSVEPSFFSFNSFHDLCRLSKLAKKELVIFWTNTISDTRVNVFHDFRFLSPEPHKESVFLLVTSDKKELHSLNAQKQKCLRVNTDYFASTTTKFDTNWSHTLTVSLGVPLVENCLLANLPQDLQQNRQQLFAHWKEPILFVSLGKTKLASKTNACVIKKPAFSHFVTVALVGPPLSQMSALDVESVQKVACFVGDATGWQVCLLNPLFRKHVIQQLIKTSHKDKLQNRSILDLPSVSRNEALSAAAVLKEKKKKYVTRAEQKGRKCVCEICSDNSYSNNMSKVGPERLITYQPDVTELLRLMGLDTGENILAIERLCDLSVAAMDIESTTLPLDLDPPVDRATGVDHSVIDGVILEGHLQKIKKPLMNAHMEALMDEPKVFVVKSDQEESIYDMMKDYWSFVRQRHDECRREKKNLVDSLLELLSEYKLKHTQFYMSWKPTSPPPPPPPTTTSKNDNDDEAVDIPTTWRQSVPGKLNAALRRLISNYAVFSFYG